MGYALVSGLILSAAIEILLETPAMEELVLAVSFDIYIVRSCFGNLEFRAFAYCVDALYLHYLILCSSDFICVMGST